ncbi:TetR/AcrR family transcriptional regulator [Streptomyces chiangmaiensis]|uniref:TetR family transcriptional regulator n=1 Tax=Streptomyces chiangmaiensis TaxID=766497 RepID=A0ABU7FE64_9ACTN|nr:TetR family transcriptional regulator [Streptomyces chiangmaiensis]MED7822452.1 TetR family transcriptional regulator [Streptomyces chiangmaiensis]
MNKTRGRPPGRPATKARIAHAARHLFLERGYQGTTLRAVAAEADVDVALIGYHFGSKQGLFGESMNLRCGRSHAIVDALNGDPAGLADRLLDAVTALWEDPSGAGFSTVDGTALRDEDVMRVFREFLEREVLGRIADHLGGRGAEERATAAVAVIGGLIFTRYLNPLGPVAALDAADVRRILGPPLRAALHGRPRAPRPSTQVSQSH